MELAVMPGRPATTHDLIRLREPIALTVDASVPAWVEPALDGLPGWSSVAAMSVTV